MEQTALHTLEHHVDPTQVRHPPATTSICQTVRTYATAWQPRKTARSCALSDMQEDVSTYAVRLSAPSQQAKKTRLPLMETSHDVCHDRLHDSAQ